MTRVRFLMNRNELEVVDGEPGNGEINRSQAQAWKDAGVPLEFIEDAAPATPPKKPARQRGQGS